MHVFDPAFGAMHIPTHFIFDVSVIVSALIMLSTAIFAFAACFAVPLFISVLTGPRPDHEQTGLVYSLTKRRMIRESRGMCGRPSWEDS